MKYICSLKEFHQQALIPTWLSDYIQQKLWYEITYPFPNFNGGTIEAWE